MKIGYARVSTPDQNINMQEDALQKAGCEKIFKDVSSGAKSERTGFLKALNYARPGDVIVVWRLDRLGRSIKHLIETISNLTERNIGFTSLQENIDTSTTGGKLVFHIFSALAEFERELIRERTNSGLQAARQRGKIGGRSRVLSALKIKNMIDLYNTRVNTVPQICKIYGISRQSFYNYLREFKKTTEGKSNAI